MKSEAQPSAQPPALDALPSRSAVLLSTITLFCKAAELGGFTAAAQALGLTPAAVSRGVGRLEARLGVALFRRSTRRMQLTDDGLLYFTQCRQALAQIDEAEAALSSQSSEPRGRLRISAPTTYAHHRLLPRLGAFARLHPRVQLEVNVSNRNVDFTSEGYDLAVRLGEPPDSRLVARKLEDAPLGIFAAPSYLARCGPSHSLADLQDASRHTPLAFVRPSTGRRVPWMLNDAGRTLEWLPAGGVAVSDDPLGCVSLARGGAGLVQTFTWVASGFADLVPVFPALAGCSRPFYAIFPQAKQLSPKVRALVDFLVQPG